MTFFDRPALSSRENLAWAVVGGILYTAAQWLVVIVLARLGTAETTGYYSYALAVTGPIVVFANFNLRTIQATDVRAEFAFTDYLRLRSLLLVAAAVAIGVAAATQRDARTHRVLLVLGAAKLVEGLSDVAHGLFQRSERMDLVGASVALRGMLTLAAMAVVYRTTHDLATACAAALAVTIVVGWFLDRRAAIALLARSASHGGAISRPPARDRSERAARTWALVKLAWPLGAMALLDSLLPNLPRFYLKSQYGMTAVGVYSAVAYLMFLGNFFVTAIGQAVTPRLASAYHDSAEAFRTAVLQLAGVGCVLGAGGVVFAVVAGRFVLARVYGPTFAAYGPLFVWVMVGAGIFYIASLLWYAAIAARRISSQAVILSAAVGVTAAACAVLIPRAGLLGASWALTAGFTVRLVGCALALVRVRAPTRVLDPARPRVEDAMPALASS